MMVTLKKSEIRPVISNMEPWQRISLLAGSLTRIASVFTVFADDDEKNVYFTTVEELWSSIEGRTGLNAEQVYSRFLMIWPYGDEDEADDDNDDSFDLYTPVYWKLQALEAAHTALWFLRSGDTEQAALHGACMDFELVEVMTPEEEGPAHREGFTREAKANILSDVEVINSGIRPEDAARHIRESAREQAETLGGRMMEHVVRVNRWTPEDLVSARGVQRA